MSTYSLSDEQLKRAEAMRWYHALEFGSHQARGRNVPPTPHNMTLYGVMDLLGGIDVSGMTCLEIGPAHGLISLGLAMRGAEITACDIGGDKPPQITLAEEVYGVSIDYKAPVALETVQGHFEPATFDLIICAGVMYHLINPADVFFRLRPLMKAGGLLVMETAHAEGVEDPVLVLNTENPLIPEPTTYFLPSFTAAVGMAKLACFDVLATRTNSPSRLSLVAKAVRPQEISDRSEMLKKVHDTGIVDPMFNLQNGEGRKIASSDIRYEGARDHRRIDVHSYIPDFPSHPKALLNPIGQTFFGNAPKAS